MKCTIVVGSENRVNLSVKLNNENISTQSVSNGTHNLIIPKDKLYPLSIGSSNTITVIASNSTGKSTSKTCIFTIINTKPSINISSISDTQTTFTVLDLDNNLNRIEFYLDSILLETMTTDLYLEKTLNYTLEDNAIHTVKIKATDETNEFTEKVVSISKNIMPLQEDFTITDFNNSLSEFKTTFLNGKTSIINTLALKNIEASLNNTLVELSEKIKTSFDSSDASVQELQNRITELNNQLSQRKRRAKGTFFFNEETRINFRLIDGDSLSAVKKLIVPINLDFTPSIIIINEMLLGSYVPAQDVKFTCITNLSDFVIGRKCTNEQYSYTSSIKLNSVTQNSFTLSLQKVAGFDKVSSAIFSIANTHFDWVAYE
ncbi:hypothetical protein [Clostridioides sp. ES-S-0001-02]|uniref:hypothetical protein n=1 Tax=Clostridioides sp. ES-S-0001-02 TaxID=2770770 RepID=UPI001D12098C|nr:hypothetical protein [Clostridioides sp. ES-S-0001-02]